MGGKVRDDVNEMPGTGEGTISQELNKNGSCGMMLACKDYVSNDEPKEEQMI